MSAEPFSWDDLRLVLAIAETGGLAPAGERLGLNGSTVFRRLGQIEARLGLKIFERRRSGYTVSVCGADMVALARRMDEEVVGLQRRFAGGAPAPSGEVRVTTNDGLLVHVLAPIFARFRADHPAIRLDVVLSNEALNLSRRDADVAIRATEKPPETLVGRRAATIAWATYGAAASWADGPPSRDRLAAADWVAAGDDLNLPALADLVRGQAGPDHIAFKANTVLGMVEAVRAGIGIGPLPCFTADGASDLVRLSGRHPALETPLWILTHPDLRDAPRVRALLDHLAAEIVPLRARFAGDLGSDPAHSDESASAQ